MRFIDLFCGIGGFHVALASLGHECVFACDINEKAAAAYETNFEIVPRGDITQIPVEDIPEHDIICGGFPCQPFSIAGSRAGFSDKTRGNLFLEILRIAKHHRPKVMVLENVRNMTAMQDGDVFDSITCALADIGYVVVSMDVLNASRYAIPQARERVYIVCIREDLYDSGEVLYVKPRPLDRFVTLESVLEENPEFKPFKRTDLIVTIDESKDTVEKNEPIRVATIGVGSQGERVYSVKGHAVTQSAHGGGVGGSTGLYRTAHGIRQLTITECKRVMGFPDSHVVSDGREGFSQLGNAVVPEMIRVVFRGFKWK